MFDAADSLLSNRENAARNWEVSQVNELLTHMEDHALPFIATTNLAKRLDPASLRRFTFKLELLPLTLLGLKRAYEHYFDAEAPPSILTLTTLTAGDFHVVKKRCDILGVQNSKDIARELIAESEAKNPASKPIGFKLHSLSS
jgi:SpoVK/Ycf46/Vps4 family AAA+-type ATPase